MLSKFFFNISEYGLKNTVLLIVNKIFGYNRYFILQDAINSINAKTYLEIGVREGLVFKRISGDTLKLKIGVDPFKHENMNKLAVNEHFFHKTSDDFFEKDAEQFLNGQSIDVAFIDGLHEFEQVIKDFYNTLRLISSNGIIVIHDCHPFTQKNQETRPQGKAGRWNGDVWKLPYYIISKRDDFRFVTLNCDNGLGIAYGFSKKRNDKLDFDEVKRIKKLGFKFLKENKTKKLNLVLPFNWRFIKREIMLKNETNYPRP